MTGAAPVHPAGVSRCTDCRPGRSPHGLAMSASTPAQRYAPGPPLAPKRPRTVRTAGTTYRDEFAWLEELKHPLVNDLIARERAYVDAYFAVHGQLPSAASQLWDWAPAGDVLVAGAPDHPARLPRVARWAYSTRTHPEDPNWVTQLVRTSHRTGKVQVVADLDRIAPRRVEYLAAVSPNEKLVAVLVDHTGAERYELVVIDIASQSVRFRRRRMGPSVLWYPDSVHLLATTAPRPGAGLAASAVLLDLDGRRRVVHEVREPHVALSITPTSDAEWVAIELDHAGATEVLVAPATPDAEFRQLIPPRPGRTTVVDHHAPSKSWVVAVTDDNTSRILSVPDTERPNTAATDSDPLVRAKTLFEVPPRSTIASHLVFARHVAVFWHHGTSGTVTIVTLDRAGRPTATHDLEWGPGPGTPMPLAAFEDADPVGSVPMDFTSSLLHVVVARPHRPRERRVYDMATRTTRRVDAHLLGKLGVGYRCTEHYMVDELAAHALDTTAIPITLVHHRDTPLDASAPCLVVAYGAYGTSLGLQLTPMDLALMERGMVIAHCHVRGGGEYGRLWHNQGRLFSKSTGIADLIACVTHLADTYVDRARIAGWGGSAAGVLFGAALNWRPELLRALCLRVPFLDALGEMADPMSRLAAHEYREWGNPALREQRRVMSSWSPYENLTTGHYPAVLVSCARNDPRVSAAGILKWAQRLRRVSTSGHPVLVDMHTTGGHSSGDPAREIAFLCTELSLRSPDDADVRDAHENDVTTTSQAPLALAA